VRLAKMSEKETVEVTIKVPKSLMDLLEEQNYFGWEKEDFFKMAIKSGISITVDEMTYDEIKRFNEKYGKDITTIYFPTTFKLYA